MSWWRRTVIEPIHAMAYSGRFTINNWYALQAIKAVYFTVPVALGLGVMSMVNEGGAMHQGAREAVLANREELMESHRKRMEEAKRRTASMTNLSSDMRMHTKEDHFKHDLQEVLTETHKKDV
eukprot:CAMPEP_0206241522 /NCGR_PEP_ID=MMETSP0047_2-20121206/16537_1 /ASSEMBLY_ACC=CAM_ASM_000192 /TAXON_ID=195065 /ORGANISM="Chroomonas mesostigmatica_cf, Strain CCMP1168" /LENGTH=122 /DNA_ID=CAMNT_0053666417 /DNA_START=102 /DNA_END=470 /DNA_ORIENTATION=+